MSLDRRLQILLDEPRFRRVEAAARARKASIGAVIREAIDIALPVDVADRRLAAETILAAEPMSVPETPDGLKAELNEIRGGGH